MACEYFVNGTWVSELEFKEILNNGLLDNLINDGGLSLEGFKTRDTGATDKTPQVITRTDIPAEKLADILSKEISTRTGYPLNMLEALELTDDKKDFKIPLWASPYAGKFESLLTSLVSNKVIKQKMLGNSYVLASEEGFRINENATKEDFAKLGVVFSANFDPKKGLQPMRVDPATGKMLPAQVMLPFKFRDERGNILDLKQFTYTDENGKTLLDTTKFPEKLLNIFGFRIPTQERNSMSAIEIVGFLPEISGDLILAPRDFTKQMGSDFDVDKLYTYMYNHFYQDGKLYTNFLSDAKKIEAQIKLTKEILEELQGRLKLSKEESKILRDYIKNTVDSNIAKDDIDVTLAAQANEIITKSLNIKFLEPGQIETLIERLSVLNRSYVAARQNKILDIHNRIMTSSNPDVVASIISLDSFGEFKDLAAEVNKVGVQQGLVPALTTTILSETYQRTKYINATAGKDGVGAFSLDSTFNATAQGKDLIYLSLSEEASDIILQNPNVTAQELLELNNVIAKFGDIESKGDMSNEYTLRSQAIIKNAKAEKRALTQEEKDSLKFKSTIIRALQSSAVDNEKEQILDKLNINSKTFDTIRGLAILGFEEKDIVGLITQEIVWEYLDKLAAAQSSLQGFTANAEQTVIDELKKKYDAEGRLNSLSAEEISRLSDISGEDLLDIIANKKLVPTAEKEKTSDDNLVQLLLLDKFKNIAEVGKTIKKLQSTINVESNGLPKSLLENSIKVDQTTRMPLDVFNAEKLLGEYKEGKLEKPTTINGFAVKYGAYFANSVFNKYFPYNTQGFNLVVTEVLEHVGKSGDFSVTKKAELMQEIMEGIKSYIFSSSSTGLYTENANNERQRLFVDSPTNQSLATVLSKLSNQNWFIQNSFLNKLTFDLSTDGKSPSRVNFEAAAGENFDERGIYLGFLYMLQNTSVVGEFNGITYTQRMLAQELIAAAYLEGGTQGAKQYLKYIPVNYLKTTDFADFLSSVSFDFSNTFEGAVVGQKIIYPMPSRFTRQFLQNNPDLVKTINFEDIEGTVKDTPETFVLSKKAMEDNIVKYLDPISGEENTTFTKFLSIYDSNSPGNFAVYEYNTSTNEYNKISTLTNKYGFTQYNFNGEAISVVEPTTVTKTIPQTIPTMVAPANTSGPIKNNNPIPTNIKDSLKLNNRLGNSVEVLNDLFNKLEESDFLSSLNRELISRIRELKLPNNFKLELGTTKGKGSFNPKTNILKLNIANHEDLNDLATTLTHELIHAVTSESLKAPQDSLNAEQILAIKLLKAAQDQYIRNLISKEGVEGLNSFTKSYHTWRYNNGDISKEQLDYILKELNLSDAVPLVDIRNKELLSKYYGAVKIEEFVTMALTDAGFQNILNNIPDENATVWQKFKDAILSLLNSLGFDVKEGSLLALAVDRSLDLIEANQRVIKSEANTGTQPVVATPTAKPNVQKISVYQQLTDNPITVASKGLYAYYIGRNGSTNPPVKLQGIVVAVSNNGYKVKKADGTISNWINYKKTIGGEAVYNMFANSILEDILPASNVQPTVVTPVVQATGNKYELFPGVFANQGQADALDELTAFLDSDKKAFLLQGKGGTGKTTIIKKIVKEAKLKGKTILAIAPTHKAKKVLASSLDDRDIKTTTLASALAIKLDETSGKFTPDEFARSRNKFPITQASLVVIDESSMISDALLAEIKTFLPANAKIIFMGDKAQLPPVGQEKDSAVFDVKNGYELTEKMRQAASSPIINIGTKVAENVETTGQQVANPIEATDRVNSTDPISGSSVVWESSEDVALNAAVNDFKEANGDVNYAKVITFNNQNHPNAQSVKNLNIKIREKLYGPEAAKEQFIKGEILTAYDTFGGEIPIFFNSEDLVVEDATAPTETTITATASSGQRGVRSKDFKFNVITLTLKNEDGSILRNVPVIAESSKAEFAATVKELFKTDGQLAYALLNKVANLDYGYAITSHKAQGSTYTNVYVMEDNIMGPSNGGTIKAKNQSLYVAVSRPTTKLVMVSNKNTPAPKKFSINNLSPEDIERMKRPLEGTAEEFLPDNSWKTEDNNDICNPF